MSKHSFINVIIPAFNEEKYLPLCLETFNNQTYHKDRFKITVVDNNSTDKTAAIAKKYGASVIFEKKQGHVFALSTGINSIKEGIIAVTDADTQVAFDWLSTIEKVFTDPKTVAVTGLISSNTKSKFMKTLMDMFYIVFVNVSAFIGKPNLSGCNFAVRKDAFIRAGGVNTLFKMSSDVDLGIRLAKIGKVKTSNNLRAVTNMRRWENGLARTLLDYTKGYIYAVWLRIPPPVKQKVIR